MRPPRIAALILAALLVPVTVPGRADEEGPPPRGPVGEAPGERRRREMEAAAGGLPPAVIARQSTEEARLPPIEEAVRLALEAAREAARPLLEDLSHPGRRLVVPDEHASIQAALDAAGAGDVVVVKQGTYYEQITMKDGVKLVSDASDGGDELVAVEGARLRLPRRALRTILDGSRAKPSRHGMVDFVPGTGRQTVVDGFTIQRLPAQDHHVPGHAHGLNLRGASPVVVNCLIRDNGSTGLGNHVVYKDQAKAVVQRDFRWANVAHRASAVLYHNVVRGSLGRGIGCNHFATPYILGNEVFDNADDETGEPGPGIGAKHGAAPTVVGNIVHDNPGGGIMTRVGAPQGIHPIDRPPRPTIERNVVYENGTERAAISASGAGTEDTPVRIVGNFVFGARGVGIGAREGTVAVIEDNVVQGASWPGVAIRGSTVLRLDRNRVVGGQGPAFAIVGRSRVLRMAANAARPARGPPFVVRDSTVLAGSD